MTWAIDTRDLAYIRSFGDAEKHWNETKPWKSEPENKRQLGDRRAFHKHIVQHEDRYELVLYTTALVIYFRNGDIGLRFHSSVSSNAFRSALTPGSMLMFNQNGASFVRVNTPEGEMNYSGNEMLRFAPGQKNQWALTNPQRAARFNAPELDRSGAAAARKAIKPFEMWNHAMNKMGAPATGWSSPHGLKQAAHLLAVDKVGPERYLEVRRICGRMSAQNSSELRDAAYWETGAKVYVPVPLGLLPGRMAVAA